MHTRISAILCTAVLALLPAISAYAADKPETNPFDALAKPAAISSTATTSAVLRLNDGYVSGELRDCDQPDIIRWQSESFLNPFDFQRGHVAAIHFPVGDEQIPATGEYCFELQGGDLVFGKLKSLTADELELELDHFGPAHVKRSGVRRISRWRDGGNHVYVGPRGLNEWDDSSTKPDWREEANQLVTQKKGAVLRGDFGIPVRSAIEFEISWLAKPDFVLALAVDKNPKRLEQAFRFEVWDDTLVIVRSAGDQADLASVAKVEPRAGRIHLVARLDQEADRLMVFSSEGEQLADLTLPDGSSNKYTGLQIIHKQGGVRLERLRIGPWTGDAPQKFDSAKTRLHRVDGSIVYGEVVEMNPATQEYVIATDSGETRVKADDVESVVLSTEEMPPTASIQAALRDTARISGELVKVENGKVWLTNSEFREPLPVPVADLQSLLILNAGPLPVADPVRKARLEVAGTQVFGSLVPNTDGDAGHLVWQPIGSTTAAALKSNTVGKIVYRERKNTVAPANRQPARTGRAAPVLWGLLGDSDTSAPTRASASMRRSLHLRTGDTIPCSVTSIDERGVHLESPISKSTFIPHDKIKALKLDDISSFNIKVGKIKRERLLTLPRMQRDNPPTHLIRSRNGDYLRGRLLSMTDTKLIMEIRLEPKEIDRKLVSQIIWLHDDEYAAPADGRQPLDAKLASAGLRVQALRRDGNRLTFTFHQLVDSVANGTSEVLGDCQIDLGEVDQLLLGTTIDAAASELVFHRFRLQNAVDPQFVSASEGGGGSTGTESTLVGKPAPDFELETIAGETFRLSNQKGRVVVLDFWASWCGPCIQAMPQVDEAVRAFQDRNVILMAVNIQEDADQVKKTLERLNLQTDVALDLNGGVAEDYQATAIPQTVIIDAEGKVARLFIGGDKDFGTQLQQAIDAVLKGEAPAENPEQPPAGP